MDTDAGSCDAAVTYIIPDPTDNCTGVTSAADIASGSTFNVGTTTVTVTATDGAGNTAQCTFDVTVNDNEDPVANCPADITVDTDAGSCDAVVTYTIPDPTDNCSVT